MSKIVLDFFEGEAEIVEFDNAAKRVLEFVLPAETDGFISIDGIAAKVSEGRCIVDARLFDNGKYTPVLIQRNSKSTLPAIVKNSEGIFPLESGSEYIRKLSIRERELRKKVKALEEKIEKIYKSVYGESIL